MDKTSTVGPNGEHLENYRITFKNNVILNKRAYHFVDAIVTDLTTDERRNILSIELIDSDNTTSEDKYYQLASEFQVFQIKNKITPLSIDTIVEVLSTLDKMKGMQT